MHEPAIGATNREARPLSAAAVRDAATQHSWPVQRSWPCLSGPTLAAFHPAPVRSAIANPIAMGRKAIQARQSPDQPLKFCPICAGYSADTAMRDCRGLCGCPCLADGCGQCGIPRPGQFATDGNTGSGSRRAPAPVGAGLTESPILRAARATGSEGYKLGELGHAHQRFELLTLTRRKQALGVSLQQLVHSSRQIARQLNDSIGVSLRKLYGHGIHFA